MFRAIAVLHFAVIRRVLRGLQEIFQVINRVVQEISVGGAHVDVQLALQLRPKRRPVALHDRAEIVVLFPIGGDAAIDFAGLFVENLFRIAIVADRSVDRLPDIELLAGPGMRSERELVLVHALHRAQCASEVVAHGGLRHFRVRAHACRRRWGRCKC